LGEYSFAHPFGSVFYLLSMAAFQRAAADKEGEAVDEARIQMV
jgi:hypothetical protein